MRLLDISAQYSRYLPYFTHHLIKLIGENRLRSIRESVFRIVMDFHHQSICSHGHGRTRERYYLIALSGSMTRINHDW